MSAYVKPKMIRMTYALPIDFDAIVLVKGQYKEDAKTGVIEAWYTEEQVDSLNADPIFRWLEDALEQVEFELAVEKELA